MRFPNNRWPNNLGTLAGEKRRASIVEETANAARADRKMLIAIAVEARKLADAVRPLVASRQLAKEVRTRLLLAADAAEEAALLVESSTVPQKDTSRL